MSILMIAARFFAASMLKITTLKQYSYFKVIVIHCRNIVFLCSSFQIFDQNIALQQSMLHMINVFIFMTEAAIFAYNGLLCYWEWSI
jgi:hypothetical protein